MRRRLFAAGGFRVGLCCEQGTVQMGNVRTKRRCRQFTMERMEVNQLNLSIEREEGQRELKKDKRNEERDKIRSPMRFNRVG